MSIWRLTLLIAKCKYIINYQVDIWIYHVVHDQLIPKQSRCLVEYITAHVIICNVDARGIINS